MLYDYPEYYDVYFSFRDFAREAEFMTTCIERYSSIPVKRVFEVACGPAPHAHELARRGFRYVGLDINRNMLDHARYKWRHLTPPPQLVEADMVSFQYDEKVDFAFVMLGSLYLNSIDEMNSHFDSMAKILNDGGLYFLDWCFQFSDPLQHRDGAPFRIERDGIEVKSRFNIKLVDSSRQMYEEIWTININDHGRHLTFEMIERNKAIFPLEFLKFVDDRPDFEFVGWWKDWDLAKPINDYADVTRPVALLKKVPGKSLPVSDMKTSAAIGSS